MSPIFWMFGYVAHPNMILPRWYTEGLAVYMESAHSNGGGRLNSQYVEGIARSLTLEKKWEDYPLSQLNDGQFDWIGGSRAYVFGGMLWDSIIRDGGEKTIYDFNQSYSRRIPYFLDGVIESNLDRNYDEQLEKAYKFWNSRAQAQIDKVNSKPQITGRPLRRKKDSDTAPSISPDGLWMAFLTQNDDGLGNINITLRHPKKGFHGYKPIQVEEGTRAQTIAWHPAATGFVYEKLDTFNFYYHFNDLYFYDLRKRKSKRLTTGARAHHPCFSPSGDKLYFIQNRPGAKQISVLDMKTKKTEVLLKGEMGHNFEYLTCPSKNYVLFVEQKPGNTPHIAKFHLETKSKSTFFDKIPVKFIKWTNDGLLFSSDASGVENLYLATNPEPPISYKAITNSKTRALSGDIDPLVDGLYYSQYTAKGHKIFSLKGAQWESLPDRPPQVEPIVNYVNKIEPDKTPKKEESERTPSSAKNSKEFSPWRYLVPNHWIPFLFIIPEGTLYQASTSAGDPLGINSYSLIGQWDTLTQKTGAAFNFFNNSLPVTLGVGAADMYSYFYATGAILNFKNYTAMTSWRMFSPRLRFMARWNYSRLNFTNNEFVRQGPQVQMSYARVEQKGNQSSPTGCWIAQLGYKAYLPALGNTFYRETYAHLGTYWTSFTPKRPALY
ncbi:MAG: PD40 domain-containing protein, partial [Bdellovibrionales bacterium]|nr:hypothetical protein [Bdellovibrionales bacterium]NQZ19831.1 PD40 domain-containing protein [Bdellovibrionales bacterium]